MQPNAVLQQSENGQGVSVSPEYMIQALMNRLQQLTMENAMQAAYITQLESEARAAKMEDNGAVVPTRDT